MAILTALYNAMIILFIALHLAVGGALTFGAGVYAGIYICQNYEVPRVDEPQVLWKKIQEFVEKHRKQPPQ